ncbi:hypothetical protein [Streptomyces sp. NPDC026092]|uniref:hypothetical protein n=1 Tax=Streptomyces sp. NPDC026092 TaxID=3154797 RepID=UPI0033C33D5E
MELEEAYKAGRPLPPERVAEAVGLLHSDWQAAGGKDKFKDVLAFSDHVAKTVSATSQDRGEVRAFWSWRSQPEGAPREVGHRFLAQACGESRGYQVLEDTPVGRRLESYELWDEDVQAALTDRYLLDEDTVSNAPYEIWDGASAEYAKEVTGQVAVFAAEIGADSILGKTEMPKILGPQGVGRDAVGFPIDFPHQAHLPAEMHDLLADPAVRCQLRREDYLPGGSTPETFVAKLAALDVPEHQKEALAAAVAQLSAVETYEELTGPAAENDQPEVTQPEVTAAEVTAPEVTQPEVTAPETKVPAPAGPAAEQPAAEQPKTTQPEVKAPVPKQPEVKQPTAANAFMPGVEMPKTITVPARRAASASTHGVINPTIEAAPKSTDVER